MIDLFEKRTQEVGACWRVDVEIEQLDLVLLEQRLRWSKTKNKYEHGSLKTILNQRDVVRNPKQNGDQSTQLKCCNTQCDKKGSIETKQRNVRRAPYKARFETST